MISYKLNAWTLYIAARPRFLCFPAGLGRDPRGTLLNGEQTICSAHRWSSLAGCNTPKPTHWCWTLQDTLCFPIEVIPLQSVVHAFAPAVPMASFLPVIEGRSCRASSFQWLVRKRSQQDFRQTPSHHHLYDDLAMGIFRYCYGIWWTSNASQSG